MKPFLSFIAGLIIFFLFIFIIPWYPTTISSTELGVKSDWGKIQMEPVTEGLVFYNPVKTDIKKIDMRERTVKVETQTVSKEGLQFGIDITVRYRVKPDKPVFLVTNLQVPLHELMTSYANATIDDIATGKDKNELYSDTGRVEVTQAVEDKLNTELGEYAVISQVIFEDIKLPASITTAIEKQQAALEQIKEKENLKAVAEKEADIRRIEAQGVADANNIIQKSLTREYLQYEAIQKLNPGAQKVFIPTSGISPVIDFTR